MKPVHLYDDTSGTRIETDDLGFIVDPLMIVTRKNTLLDPRVMKRGAWIKFSGPVEDYVGRLTDRMWVPPMIPLESNGMWNIHPVIWTANQVLRVREQIDRGTTRPAVLQSMYSIYQRAAERDLVGKTGLIRNVLVATRMKSSGRAVLVPNGNFHPSEVGIPGRFFASMDISHGDLILIGRNPTIWSGSMEIVRARKTKNDVVELHPLLFSQLGGDCDGDDIYFVPVPKDEECQKEAEPKVLEFCMKHGKWHKQALVDLANEIVDWENPTRDTKKRLTITGFSISPEDILRPEENKETWETMERLAGKTGLAKQCFEIASGLDKEEVRKIFIAKNEETLRMKKHLGVIGIACNRMKILSRRVPAWSESADYASERFQQILLDSKHLGDSYSALDVIAILNKKGKWKKVTLKTVVAFFREMPGIDVERMEPILEAIYIAYPLMGALQDIMPATCNLEEYYRIIRRISAIGKTTVLRSIERTMLKDGAGNLMPHLIGRSIKLSLGLTEMATRFYPLHEAIASVSPARSLTKRIFHERTIDEDGPCRQAWEVWHDMAGVEL